MRKTLFEMTAQEAEHLFRRTKWAIMPVGSVEQHGPHLPLGTDAMGAIEISRRVSDLIPIIVAPPITLGYSPYHMGWRGSITLNSQTVISLYRDVADSLIRHGIEVIVFVNGHGGNKALVEIAASDIQQETAARTFVINWPYFGADLMDGEMDLAHAGHFETASVMGYDAALIDIAAATNPSDYETTIVKQQRYRGNGAYPVRRDFAEIQETGWSGRPWDATAEGSEALYGRASEAIAALLQEEFGEAGWAR